MALVPSKTIETTLEVPAEWAEGTEQIQQIHTKLEYYTPAQGGDNNQDKEDLLIDSDRSVTNRYGTLISRDVEHWMYDVYKGPPTEYTRERWSNAYLPGIGGRVFRKVQEEQTYYWAFTPFTDGDNLGKTRKVSGWVIYDLKVVEATMTDEARQKYIDAGKKVPGFLQVVTDSGKLWEEANSDNSVVEESDAGQISIWKNDVIIEHDLIDEQPDRWIIWTLKKNTLRSGAVETIGPTEIKKTGFSYRIPYPIGPPKLDGLSTDDGVKLEATKGGALVTNSWFPIDNFVIKPEKYRFYRKKISEPTRSPEDDPYGWWRTPPLVTDSTSIIENTAVTDFAGGAASALPGQTTYTEPHDPNPIDPPDAAAFKLIATVDNTKDRHTDEGYGTYTDQDVVSGGEYEYYATAVINDDESPHSNHEIITYNGAHDRHYRITKRELPDGTVETDALAPDDPLAAPGIEESMGEVTVLEVPTTDDPIEVTEQIADRIFSTAAMETLNLDLEILIPLLGLEYGQRVVMPQVVWEAFGSDRHLTSQTIDDEYMLQGFRLKVERSQDGSWKSQKTTLKLSQAKL